MSSTGQQFESVNLLAKNEAPLSLFPKLISHKERHGIIVDTAHCNRTSGMDQRKPERGIKGEVKFKELL